MTALKDLVGKRVWITGASSGIGAGLARAFAREGCFVILSGRDEVALARVAKDVPNHLLLPFDVTDYGAYPDLVAKAGVIDLLILNAGVTQRSLCEDTVMHVYRTLMEVDYFAPITLAKLVLPQMLERGSGHLAVTASVAGKVGSPQRTGYCGAKHAVMGFFDALRTEVEHRGVGVTTIVPGLVKTPIGARGLTGSGAVKGDSLEDDVDGGISVEEAATIIVDGFRKGLREIAVGGDGQDMALLDLKRKDPDQLFDLMSQIGEQVVAKFKAGGG